MATEVTRFLLENVNFPEKKIISAFLYVYQILEGNNIILL